MRQLAQCGPWYCIQIMSILSAKGVFMCTTSGSSLACGVPQGIFYGELFGQLGLVLGTSQDPVATYFIEPAFVNSTVGKVIWA